MSATMVLSTCACFALLALVSVQGSARYTEAEKDLMDIMSIIMKPRQPERFSTDFEYKIPKIDSGKINTKRILKFSYNDCGTPADSLRIQGIKLTPDPLVFPGQIGVTFNLTNSRNATGPIQVQVTMRKKIVFWIEVPCIDNVGSCTYSDICKMLPQSQCPASFVQHKVPCRCPIPKGQFNLPLTKFNANVKDVPGGDYNVKAVLKSAEGPLACLNVDFSVA